MVMKTNKTDVFISGGGIAGLVATIAFEKLGHSVICVDPEPPVHNLEDRYTDTRTTAFLQPSQRFLKSIDLWERLANHCMPLDVMRIVDAGGNASPSLIRERKDFKSREVSDLPFGWNVPNWLLRRELLAVINSKTNALFLPGVATREVYTRDHEARVTLSNGQGVNAKLIVAADGRKSVVRQKANIDVCIKRFGQKAMSFAVTHANPHKNVSTEIHKSGGPFTLVPLADYKGSPSSAVVWMEKSKKAVQLMSLETAKFEDEINERSCNILGPLKLVTKRSMWPIVTQVADRLSAKRTALIAEAAHVVPPIGAQGLNMSIRDIKVLRDLTAKTKDIGSPDLLETYHNERINDIRMRVFGVTLLNKISQNENRIVHDMRAYGLRSLYGNSLARKIAMELGLGV